MNTPKCLAIATRGESVLQQRAKEVTQLDDPELQTIIENMLVTVNAANGVGLAAPQVFIPLRIIIVASKPNKRYPFAPFMQPLAMINPQILWQAEETLCGWEGCLSVPGLRSQVKRPQQIRVRYLDRHGIQHETDYSDFVARIILHECDHLDGKLFLDRLDDTDEVITEEAFQALFPD